MTGRRNVASEDVSVSLRTISDHFNYVVFVMEKRCAFCEVGNNFGRFGSFETSKSVEDIGCR
jgi:hypothetical protein